MGLLSRLPAGWIGPSQCQWLAGGGLDTGFRVVDDIAAALRSDKCSQGKNRNPGTHVVDVCFCFGGSFVWFMLLEMNYRVYAKLEMGEMPVDGLRME